MAKRKYPQARRRGMVDMHTRVSFHPTARPMAQAATKVVTSKRIVIRVIPDSPARWEVSVDRKDVRAPEERLSKKAMS
jgi:hypothetical protein